MHRHTLVSKMLPIHSYALKILVLITCEGALPITALYAVWRNRLAITIYVCPFEVRWLSRVKVISGVCALSAELFKFLQYHNQRHLKHFEGSKFLFIWLIWSTFLVPFNRIKAITGFGKIFWVLLLVVALVTSRLDYCNSLLNGLSQTHILRLQRVQNTAARLICRIKKFDHISTSLQSLH